MNFNGTVTTVYAMNDAMDVMRTFVMTAPRTNSNMDVPSVIVSAREVQVTVNVNAPATGTTTFI